MPNLLDRKNYKTQPFITITRTASNPSTLKKGFAPHQLKNLPLLPFAIKSRM